jgi:hypothetical protein
MWTIVSRVMVINATFNTISVISWRSVLLMEETLTIYFVLWATLFIKQKLFRCLIVVVLQYYLVIRGNSGCNRMVVRCTSTLLL